MAPAMSKAPNRKSLPGVAGGRNARPDRLSLSQRPDYARTDLEGNSLPAARSVRQIHLCADRRAVSTRVPHDGRRDAPRMPCVTLVGDLWVASFILLRDSRHSA